jgi:trimeric autotransporter adhesin
MALLNSTAVGANAQAVHSGSTAVGASAATTRTNQVRLGTTGTSVSIADISASDAAQTGTEFVLTIDSAGTVGRQAQQGMAFQRQTEDQISNLQSSQEVIDSIVANQGQQIATLGRGLKQANGGIAAAMALGGTMIVPDSPLSVSFNLSTYRGSQGYSGSVAARVTPKIYISGGVAGSTVKGSTGGRVGISFGL